MPLKGHPNDPKRNVSNVALSDTGVCDAGSMRLLQEPITLCLATDLRSFPSLKVPLKISMFFQQNDT